MKATPWLPFLAIDYLNSLLRPDMRVFEYGSGGSTLYLSERVGELVSVEHDPKWFIKVRAALANRGNINLRLIEPFPAAIGDDKSNPDHYTSGPLMADFVRYVSALNDYPDFDLILVDGRSRASCLAHAAHKIKPGGWVILDNAERDYYLKNTANLFDDWERVLFFGHGPYNDWPWQTLFMKAPKAYDEPI